MPRSLQAHTPMRFSIPPIESLPFPEPFSFFQPNAIARFRDHLKLAGKNVDLDGACREAARITKDGGIVFTEFGPVWTGPTGHHIYHDPGNPALDFTMRQLPTHMHLLYDRETIIQYLVDHRSIHERSAREATELVFITDNINRLPANAYFTAASRYFRPVLQEHFTSPVKKEVLELLWQRGGVELNRVGFEGGAWVLMVDKN